MLIACRRNPAEEEEEREEAPAPYFWYQQDVPPRPPPGLQTPPQLGQAEQKESSIYSQSQNTVRP